MNRLIGACRLNLSSGPYGTSVRRFSMDLNVVPTTVPSIYTEARFNPNIDLLKHKRLSQHLFDLTPKYISPQDFKHSLPTRGLPEFAFIGRSNTGKSSLISCLMGDTKGLVRISKEPGCTRSVNFFALCKDQVKGTNDHAAYFVDLPGYGFAKKSKREQSEWEAMIFQYFSIRNPATLR